MDDRKTENRMEKKVKSNRSVAMRAIHATLDKNGKRVVPGQSFYAGDDEQADKLTRLGRAKRKEKTDAKPTKRKDSTTKSKQKPA